MVESNRNDSQNVQSFNWWQKLHSIAAQLTAFIAIIGFIWSIYTSNETSKRLKQITESLVSYAQPILQFDDYVFLSSSPQGVINCENPPIGIMFYYKNKSKVPLMLYRANAKFFFGERRIGESPIRKIESKGNQILVPEDRLAASTYFEPIVVEEIKKPGRLFSGPFIEIKFEAEFSRLGEMQRYLYSTHRVIPFDCSNVSLKIASSKEESNELIKQ